MLFFTTKELYETRIVGIVVIVVVIVIVVVVIVVVVTTITIVITVATTTTTTTIGGVVLVATIEVPGGVELHKQSIKDSIWSEPRA